MIKIIWYIQLFYKAINIKSFNSISEEFTVLVMLLVGLFKMGVSIKVKTFHFIP